MVNNTPRLDKDGFVKQNFRRESVQSSDQGLFLTGGEKTFDEILEEMNEKGRGLVSPNPIKNTTPCEKIVSPKPTIDNLNEEISPPDSQKSPEDFQGVFRTLERGVYSQITDICRKNLPHPDEGKFWHKKLKGGCVAYYMIENSQQVLISEAIVTLNKQESTTRIILSGGKLGRAVLIKDVHNIDIPFKEVGGYIDSGIEAIARGKKNIEELINEISNAIEIHSRKQPTSRSEQVDGMTYTVYQLKEKRDKNSEVRVFDIDLQVGPTTYKFIDIYIVRNRKGYQIWFQNDNKKIYQKFLTNHKVSYKATETLIRKVKRVLDSKNSANDVYKNFIETYRINSLDIPSVIDIMPGTKNMVGLPGI